MPISNDDIAHYYDTHQWRYSYFWSPTGLHYGFWYDDTRNLAEAITNTDKFVVNALRINADDVVLDAGCGVGGSSVYIAEATGARVEGVTLSDVQLVLASRRAIRSSCPDRVSFSKQDYTKTSFESASFSKVFAIESICHATRKIDFLNEAYRLLIPGGRLVVVDAFMAKENLDDQEQAIYEKSIDGWVVPNLSGQVEFLNLLAKAGFSSIVFHNMQRYVEKSVKRIHRFSLATRLINRATSKLGFARENLAANNQQALFRNGLASYGVFVAQK
jgi:tocopherol O-methyltransferase